MNVTRIGDGVYRVLGEGSSEIVYVAGPQDVRWAFWNGQTFRVTQEPETVSRLGRTDALQGLTAPMPATVLKVLAELGSSVKKGDAVLILEAMKMELPVRAPADAVVTAVHCQEGDLVQPDVILVELK